jgi:ankyrin repeat protein
VQASRDALPVLIELGADPKAIDPNNRTRLHYCVESLYQGTCTADDIKQLLALGIDANQGDTTGQTALHLLMNYYQVPDETSRYGQKRQAKLADLMPMIQMLLDAGGDPDAQTYEGLTPAMLALQARMYDVAGALLERSKNPGQPDKQGLNLIHRAFLVPGMNNQFSLELTDDIRAFVELAASKGVDPRAPIGMTRHW